MIYRIGPWERTAQSPRTSNRDADPSPRLQAHRSPQSPGPLLLGHRLWVPAVVAPRGEGLALPSLFFVGFASPGSRYACGGAGRVEACLCVTTRDACPPLRVRATSAR